LIALLPKRLPTARSNAPSRTAESEATSSGKDVATASVDTPTNV
jgi:hypothetical protein